MKKLKILIPILLATITISTFDSCKSKKKALESGNITEKKSMNTLLSDIRGNEMAYQTIECKGKIELRKGNSGKKTNAVFKLVKDSMMQVSIRIPIFGGEAIRATFSPTELLIIDRLSKQYTLIKYDDIKSLGESGGNFFYNIQALFTNQLFLPGKSHLTEKDYEDFSLAATPEVYLLQTKAQGKNLYVNFAVDNTEHIISTLMHDKNKTITLQWSYLDFIIDSKSNATYPTLMEAKAEIGSRRLDLAIECPQLEINNENFKIDNSIPSKYIKVDIADIISKYMGKIQ